MSKQALNTLKNWFKTGLKPTQAQFWDWLDSFWHKDEKIPVEQVEGLSELLGDSVSLTQLNSGLADKANVVHTHTSSDLVEWLGYTPQDTEEKNQPEGYPGLDANGKILAEQLPAIAINNTFVVADEEEMLELDAETGDVAIRSDESKTYILAGEDASELSDWKELLTSSMPPVENGLSVGSNGVGLGGTLSKNTNVDSSLYALNINVENGSFKSTSGIFVGREVGGNSDDVAKTDYTEAIALTSVIKNGYIASFMVAPSGIRFTSSEVPGENYNMALHTTGLASNVRVRAPFLSGQMVVKKEIEIGAWAVESMDASPTFVKYVPHGLGANWKKIRDLSVVIQDDDESYFAIGDRNSIFTASGRPLSVSIHKIDSENVALSFFSGNIVYYQSTSINRGWITIYF